MKAEVKKSSLSILVMQRNLLFFVCVFLLLISLSITVVAVRTQSITFFKAPEVRLDLQGAQSQGEYLAHLILSRNPKNIKEQNTNLFSWVDPAFVFKLREGLQSHGREVQRNNTSFEWALLDSAVELLDKSHVRVFLKGTLSAYLPIQGGKKQLIQEETTAYILDLNLKNGKLLLSNFRKGEKNV